MLVFGLALVKVAGQGVEVMAKQPETQWGKRQKMLAQRMFVSSKVRIHAVKFVYDI